MHLTSYISILMLFLKSIHGVYEHSKNPEFSSEQSDKSYGKIGSTSKQNKIEENRKKELGPGISRSKSELGIPRRDPRFGNPRRGSVLGISDWEAGLRSSSTLKKVVNPTDISNARSKEIITKHKRNASTSSSESPYFRKIDKTKIKPERDSSLVTEAEKLVTKLKNLEEKGNPEISSALGEAKKLALNLRALDKTSSASLLIENKSQSQTTKKNVSQETTISSAIDETTKLLLKLKEIEKNNSPASGGKSYKKPQTVEECENQLAKYSSAIEEASTMLRNLKKAESPKSQDSLVTSATNQNSKKIDECYDQLYTLSSVINDAALNLQKLKKPINRDVPNIGETKKTEKSKNPTVSISSSVNRGVIQPVSEKNKMKSIASLEEELPKRNVPKNQTLTLSSVDENYISTRNKEEIEKEFPNTEKCKKTSKLRRTLQKFLKNNRNETSTSSSTDKTFSICSKSGNALPSTSEELRNTHASNEKSGKNSEKIQLFSWRKFGDYIKASEKQRRKLARMKSAVNNKEEGKPSVENDDNDYKSAYEIARKEFYKTVFSESLHTSTKNLCKISNQVPLKMDYADLQKQLWNICKFTVQHYMKCNPALFFPRVNAQKIDAYVCDGKTLDDILPIGKCVQNLGSTDDEIAYLSVAMKHRKSYSKKGFEQIHYLIAIRNYENNSYNVVTSVVYQNPPSQDLSNSLFYVKENE